MLDGSGQGTPGCCNDGLGQDRQSRCKHDRDNLCLLTMPLHTMLTGICWANVLRCSRMTCGHRCCSEAYASASVQLTIQAVLCMQIGAGACIQLPGRQKSLIDKPCVLHTCIVGSNTGTPLTSSELVQWRAAVPAFCTWPQHLW